MVSSGNELMVGAPIFTQDGEQLGKVKETRGHYFKVDAPMRADYWLSSDCVSMMTDGRVTLALTKDRLDEYKASDPGDDMNMDSNVAHGSTGVSDMGSVGAASTGTLTADSMRDAGGVATSTTGADYHAGDTAGSTATVRGTAPSGSVTGGGMRWSWDEARPEYQSEWEGKNAGLGRHWQDVEPGYRYGHEMAGDTRYQGREWNDVEPEMSTNARDWGQRAGYQWDDNNGWDQMKNDARSAWDKARGRTSGKS